MEGRSNPLATLSHFLHRYFLWLLLASYVIAGLWPALGKWIRDVTLGHLTLFGERTRLSLPMLMLALLLINAGMGVQIEQMRHLLRRPLILVAGLAANLLIPIAYIFLVTQGMRIWHNPDEVQNILVGLALVASMPIAGSSTAWSQNANGDLSLSLGLVLISTFLSPVTTPVSLHAVGLMTRGDYSEDLHELAGAGSTTVFLTVCVLVPSLLGILLRGAAGPRRIAVAKPTLKLLNSLNLLLLNYSNASVALPQTIREPDYDFLAITLLIVSGLCVLAFTSGWAIARLFRAEHTQKVALMFGLGMNNNGTGLVLASMALVDHPLVMLPIIFYNLVQHLIAGSFDFLLQRTSSPSGD